MTSIPGQKHYKIPMNQLLKESGYADYIKTLKN